MHASPAARNFFLVLISSSRSIKFIIIFLQMLSLYTFKSRTGIIRTRTAWTAQILWQREGLVFAPRSTIPKDVRNSSAHYILFQLQNLTYDAFTSLPGETCTGCPVILVAVELQQQHLWLLWLLLVTVIIVIQIPKLVHFPLCLSVCLSVCLSACLSACLSVSHPPHVIALRRIASIRPFLSNNSIEKLIASMITSVSSTAMLRSQE